MIYLASPYTPTRQGYSDAEKCSIMNARFVCAARYAAKLINEGKIVFSPITHSHPIAEFGHIDNDDHDVWLKQDLAFLALCTELHVLKLPGWEYSYGVHREKEEAALFNMPIFHIEPTDIFSGREMETVKNSDKPSP